MVGNLDVAAFEDDLGGRLRFLRLTGLCRRLVQNLVGIHS
ncbi:hypothetical protein I551_4096 [Mycobacterium ulcerans str. Harvey]|uniref:Uncharacterized protein n=1 Tax=Mycobacterium ulcerans str. Harvey TaxID=1299332 RepID=A0ABP3ADM0_MYCUL|nr:hypothetical protein I551_4096 [Mycobacterium ulcerans str. Harvey]